MISQEGGLCFEDVKAGHRLPPYAVELTLQRLVMEAGANRDFAPMHFDRDVARAEGMKDVFASTTMLQTLFEVMLRQWIGPAGRIRKLGFRMLAMNFSGQTLSAHGVVIGPTEKNAKSGLVQVEIWQETPAQGKTVLGAALVELPLRGAN